MIIGILAPDGFAPTAALTFPASGATVSGSITLTATAADNYGVVGVQFKVDGVNVGAEDMSAPYQATLDTHVLSNGAHTLTATARDAAGHQTIASEPFTVANGIAAGDLVFDEWEPSDGGGGYIVNSRTAASTFANRWTDDFIWSAWGDKATHNLPANPDPTHYQMRVQMGAAAVSAAAGGGAARVEGGTAGNVVTIVMEVAGTEYDAWVNTGPFPPFLSGPQLDISGGEPVRFTKWETSPGINFDFTQGIVAHYDFVPKAGFLS